MTTKHRKTNNYKFIYNDKYLFLLLIVSISLLLFCGMVYNMNKPYLCLYK